MYKRTRRKKEEADPQPPHKTPRMSKQYKMQRTKQEYEGAVDRIVCRQETKRNVQPTDYTRKTQSTEEWAAKTRET